VTTKVQPLVLIALAAVLAGCHPAPPPSASPGPAIRLSATLSTPVDVTLCWSGVDPRAVGSVVEFATDPAGQFAVLRFVPPDQTTLRHSDLMPQTAFSYRIRPYFGPASNTVHVTLPPGELDEKAHVNDPDWAAPRTVPGTGVATRSIRDQGDAATGAPTGLHARIADANGIVFSWTDHAGDEEGYLLEVAPSGRPFGVVAVLDADIDTVGLVTLPDEKHAAYRVRAFYYGASSALATVHTGDEGGPPTATVNKP
jgi:hypothetical protein